MRYVQFDEHAAIRAIDACEDGARVLRRTVDPLRTALVHTAWWGAAQARACVSLDGTADWALATAARLEADADAIRAALVAARALEHRREQTQRRIEAQRRAQCAATNPTRPRPLARSTWSGAA